jgi:hypothetical protein
MRGPSQVLHAPAFKNDATIESGTAAVAGGEALRRGESRSRRTGVRTVPGGSILCFAGYRRARYLDGIHRLRVVSFEGIAAVTGIFILLGGMAAFAVIITTLDFLTQRHDRNKAALLRKNSP